MKALGIVREKYQKVMESKIAEEERKPAKTRSAVTAEHLKGVFLHIAVIHGYNTLLCRRLEERIDTTNWGPNSVIGDIFVDMVRIHFLFLLVQSMLIFFLRDRICGCTRPI